MKYQLYRTQQLHCDLETAWEFFSSPYNLSRITPEYMGFEVTSALENKTMYPGMEIAYKVTPILGIPLKWVTRITEVEPYKSFTDFQEKGPYKLWNHRHEFYENDQGVLMKDHLTYEMPYGIIGKIGHALVVKKKLEGIFNYRFQVLEEMFNQ